jgi:hypothetical protein
MLRTRKMSQPLETAQKQAFAKYGKDITATTLLQPTHGASGRTPARQRNASPVVAMLSILRDSVLSQTFEVIEAAVVDD